MARTNKNIILRKIRDAGFNVEGHDLYVYRESGSPTARIVVDLDPERMCEDGCSRARLSDMKALANLFGVEDFVIDHGYYDEYYGTWTLEFTFDNVNIDILLSDKDAA